METKITEISGGIYRLSTFVPQIAPPAGFTFNQFLVLGDDPLLFHTGLRQMFPLIHSAISRLIPPERLRWITFGHYEADECGAMKARSLARLSRLEQGRLPNRARGRSAEKWRPSRRELAPQVVNYRALKQ